jgi:hypothetical protein
MLIPRKSYSGERLSRFDDRRIGGQWPRENPPEKGIEKNRELVLKILAN